LFVWSKDDKVSFNLLSDMCTQRSSKTYLLNIWDSNSCVARTYSHSRENGIYAQVLEAVVSTKVVTWPTLLIWTNMFSTSLFVERKDDKVSFNLLSDMCAQRSSNTYLLKTWDSNSCIAKTYSHSRENGIYAQVLEAVVITKAVTWPALLVRTNNTKKRKMKGLVACGSSRQWLAQKLWHDLHSS
jgi:hypothetical protein